MLLRSSVSYPFHLSYRKKIYMGVNRSSKIIMTRTMRTATSTCLSLLDGKRSPKSRETDATSKSRKCIPA